MSRRYTADDLMEAVANENSSAILTATSSEPFIINENLDDLEMSRATAYRRIEHLLSCNLLDEQTRIDEAGTQYHVYEANFQTLKLEIINGIAYLHVVRENDHDLTRLWNFK